MQVQKSAAANAQSEQKASEAAWREEGCEKLTLVENRDVCAIHVPLAMVPICVRAPYVQRH